MDTVTVRVTGKLQKAEMDTAYWDTYGFFHDNPDVDAPAEIAGLSYHDGTLVVPIHFDIVHELLYRLESFLPGEILNNETRLDNEMRSALRAMDSVAQKIRKATGTEHWPDGSIDRWQMPDADWSFRAGVISSEISK